MSLPPSYFDDVYAASADPWGFETSPYEAAKYDATLAALPRARYGSAFEAGGSIGVLTRRLADRCDALLSADVSDVAIAQARARCADVPHVRIERRVLPAEFPERAEDGAPFDLVVVSEVGYYFSADDLAAFRAACARALAPPHPGGAGGTLLLVHWTAPVHDYPLTGDAVHDAFLADPAFRHVAGSRAPEYRLDVLERAG